MKVTVRTVAERARVSVGTVSRVLNRDPSVSADLEGRVRQSITDLGYRPLRQRRTTRGSRSGIKRKTLGLLTLGMDRSLSQLPVVTAAIDGIRGAISTTGGGLQIVDAPDPRQEPLWLRRIRVDGWLIKGAMQGNPWQAAHPTLREQLAAVPCVWFHGRPRGAHGSSVGVNDWEVGALAAAHLHERGHREVAFLSPKNRHALLKRRQHGFLAACEEFGLRCRVASRDLQSWKFPLERPRSLAAVDALLEDILGAGEAHPTAIFAPADSIAVLLYRALADRGLRVPDDVSVISANREEALIAGLFPSLTTVDIHSEQIGREAVRLLEQAFQHGSELPLQDVQMAPSILPSESVKDLS